MMTKTHVPSQKTLVRNWHLIDAKGQIIGKIAGKIAILLMGKHKTDFLPNLDRGDNVVVINSKEVVATGNKESQKVYTRHSGYSGGLKQIILSKLRLLKPNYIIEHAVSGMLPKNKHRDERLKRLHIYSGDEHPYGRYFK